MAHQDRDVSRTTTSKGAGTVSLGSHEGRGLLAAAVLGTGVTFFDGDALTVALPAIADDLDVGISSMQWLLNLFVLVLGAFLLVGGSLGDRIGRRPIFLTGLVVLAAGTLVAAIAAELWMLYAARILQGAGAALVVPVSLAVVSTTFTDDDRSAAIGWWSGLTATSSVIGPVAGGFLTTVASWRGIFVTELALIAAASWFAIRHLPSTDRGGPDKHIDVAGATIAALTIVGATFALIQGPTSGWTDPFVVAAGTLSILGLPSFIALERRKREPMIPLSLFRSRRFSVGNLITVGIYFSFSGVLFLIVVLLQEALAYSPVDAGLAILPITFFLLALSPIAGRLTDRFGARLMLTIGPAIAATGLAILGITASPDYRTGLLPGLVVFGIGAGISVAPLTATVLAGVDDRHETLASSANTATARTAGLLAIAALPAISTFELDIPAPQLLDAFRTAMLVTAGVTCLAGLAALIGLPPPGAPPDEPSNEHHSERRRTAS